MGILLRQLKLQESHRTRRLFKALGLWHGLKLGVSEKSLVLQIIHQSYVSLLHDRERVTEQIVYSCFRMGPNEYFVLPQNQKTLDSEEGRKAGCSVQAFSCLF